MIREAYKIIDGILDRHPDYMKLFEPKLKRWGEIYSETDEFKRHMERLRNFNY